MARAGLKDHPKFRRLVYLLREPVPHVWGYLECLWTTAYQRRSDLIGDEIDVELSTEYPGEAGKLRQALLTTGFVERHGETYYVHDLAEHAPPYVRKTLKILCPGRPLVDQESITGQTQVDHKPTTSQPVVNQESTTGQTNPPSESTTGLQGEGIKGKGEGREGKGGVGLTPSADLAQRFLFKQTGGKENEYKLAEQIESMLTFGYPFGNILAEINKPPGPTGRDYSERFFKLKDRMEKAKRGPVVNTKSLSPEEERALMCGKKPTTEKPP